MDSDTLGDSLRPGSDTVAGNNNDNEKYGLGIQIQWGKTSPEQT